MSHFKLVEFTPSERFRTKELLEQQAAQLLHSTGFAKEVSDSSNLKLYFESRLFFILSDGCPVKEACLFLAKVSLHSRSIWGDTGQTYAKSLLPWLKYLAEQGLEGLDPKGATEEDFAAYRLEIVRAKKWASSTVHLRIQVVGYFHAWGQSTGRLRSSLGAYFLDRLAGKTPDHRRPLSPIVNHEEPRYIGIDDWLKIRTRANQPWRLLFSWAICTGLRRAEICNLRLKDLSFLLENIKANDVTARVRVTRKGGKSKWVHVPIPLIRESAWWVKWDRPGGSNGEENDFLFLNTNGAPIARNYLSRAFRAVANSVGSQATLHHLRHAFAMMVLDWLPELVDDGAPLNPMKVLQDLLGHAEQSTSEIYIRAKRGFSAAAVQHLGETLIPEEWTP